jgi:uncharacterized protein with GYD domain
MPKYLYKGSYTAEGLKGFIAGGGGSARRKAVEELAASVGGSLEAFYFALGSDDFYVVLDVPDQASVAAVALTVAASGSVRGETVVLLDAEEMDAAVARTPRYRAPGQ